MMPNHTPGPWIVDLSRPHLVIVRPADRDLAIATVINGHIRGADEHEANVQLIASAPDLLHALQVILPMALGYAHSHDVGGNQEKCEWAQRILSNAESA